MHGDTEASHTHQGMRAQKQLPVRRGRLKACLLQSQELVNSTETWRQRSIVTPTHRMCVQGPLPVHRGHWFRCHVGPIGTRHTLKKKGWRCWEVVAKKSCCSHPTLWPEFCQTFLWCLNPNHVLRVSWGARWFQTNQICAVSMGATKVTPNPTLSDFGAMVGQAQHSLSLLSKGDARGKSCQTRLVSCCHRNLHEFKVVLQSNPRNSTRSVLEKSCQNNRVDLPSRENLVVFEGESAWQKRWISWDDDPIRGEVRGWITYSWNLSCLWLLRSLHSETIVHCHRLQLLNSYRGAVCGIHFAASLTPVSAHFLRQESIPSDYLRQATCVTLGVMLNFDATQQNTEHKEFAAALYKATKCLPTPSSKRLEFLLIKTLKTVKWLHHDRLWKHAKSQEQVIYARPWVQLYW